MTSEKKVQDQEVVGEVVKLKPKVKKRINALATKTPAPVDFSVENLLTQAVKEKLPVEQMKELFALRKEVKAEFAKEQYDEAMSGFQSKCPVVVKNKEARNDSGKLLYKFASIDEIIRQVKPFLKDFGFSYSTRIEKTDVGVKAICIVNHKLGHKEDYDMEVPLGNKTGIMSNSQQFAAASTFAKRYAFCNAFGIMTGDEDKEENLKDEEKEELDLEEYRVSLKECKNLEELKTAWKFLPKKAKGELFKDFESAGKVFKKDKE